ADVTRHRVAHYQIARLFTRQGGDEPRASDQNDKRRSHTQPMPGSNCNTQASTCVTPDCRPHIADYPRSQEIRRATILEVATKVFAEISLPRQSLGAGG